MGQYLKNPELSFISGLIDFFREKLLEYMGLTIRRVS